MKQLLVVGEDALCCALGERLFAACLPGWRLAQTSINTQGITKLVPALARYANQAKHVQPVLCIADTDGQCAVKLLDSWLPTSAHAHFLLRLAVTEAESWLMADRDGFARELAVPLNKLPQRPDEEADPKRLLLTLARKSKKRLIRDELVSPTDPSKPGSGYNLHLCAFARTHWNARCAAQTSPSLARAMRSLEKLGANHG
jgi:hypothetical protein